MLFHGTSRSAVAKIKLSGLDPSRAALASRYGLGVYFSDESCKAHQYAARPDSDGEYTLLYCRVAPGRALPFRVNAAAANRGYLQGMRRPITSDAVFVSRLQAAQQYNASRRDWDSVDVYPLSQGVADGSQYHRELIVFDAEQVYPEFVVRYRLEQRLKEDQRQAVGMGVLGGADWLLRHRGWEAAEVASWLYGLSDSGLSENQSGSSYPVLN